MVQIKYKSVSRGSDIYRACFAGAADAVKETIESAYTLLPDVVEHLG
jgi:hypothetical protein